MMLDLRRVDLVRAGRYPELLLDHLQEVVLPKVAREHVPDALGPIHIFLVLARRVQLAQLRVLVPLEFFNLVDALDQFFGVHIRKLDSVFVHVLHERDVLPQTLRVVRNKLDLPDEVRFYLL